MKHNRRNFIKLGGSIVAVSALSGIPVLSSCTEDEMKKKIKKFGLQLYTLRDVLPKNPKAVLKDVSNYGYKQIESYEGPEGMFWGMGNTGFKKYMDDLDMELIASHCDISKDFEKKAAEAAAIGMKYLICPYKGPQKSADDYKKFAAEFNVKGEICRKNGLRFAYHNH